MCRITSGETRRWTQGIWKRKLRCVVPSGLPLCPRFACSLAQELDYVVKTEQLLRG